MGFHAWGVVRFGAATSDQPVLALAVVSGRFSSMDDLHSDLG